ncbi:tRNA pseudouridine(13) synthase TruD [uncultured Psychrobacter sp.]|uniref:tRNA pseudouridine(13) synthase TruD n=1 Tax=uncultured Psychrobacter sp. TaxID=259303 RepID=UPI00338D51A7
MTTQDQDNQNDTTTHQPSTHERAMSDTLTSTDIKAATDTKQLPQPMPQPLRQATYKTQNNDFIVNEVLPLDFTGEGEHLWLHIKKSGVNTAYLAKLLSEWAEIPLRDVGYSGLKDRHALTTQWFSLRLPKKQKPDSDFAPVDIKEHETVKIIAEHWHNKKLNRGTHNANQFVITLRDIEFAKDQTLGDKPSVEQHLQTISKTGVPNYFGPQRFGYEGNNIAEALRLFARPIPASKPKTKKSKRKRAPREQNAMELSAARSLIFNEILAARVRVGNWDTGLAGEVFNLDGSGSIFGSEAIDDALRARMMSGDIHPTGVLWGVGNDKVSGMAAQLESDIVKINALLTQLAMGLEQRDVKAQRRALRLPIEALSWEWLDASESNEQALVLSFTLATGSFATSVLASIVQHLQLGSA